MRCANSAGKYWIGRVSMSATRVGSIATSLLRLVVSLFIDTETATSLVCDVEMGDVDVEGEGSGEGSFVRLGISRLQSVIRGACVSRGTWTWREGRKEKRCR